MQGLLSKLFIFFSTLKKRTSFFLFIILFAAAIAEATFSFQKPKKDPDPIHFKLKAIVDPERVKPGERFSLFLKVELSAGWHIYSLNAKGAEKQPLATQIYLNSDVFIPHGHWEEPTPVLTWDGALGKVVHTHQRVVEFRRWYSVIQALDSGLYPIRGDIVYRACNNKVCNFPKKITYETKVNVLSDKN